MELTKASIAQLLATNDKAVGRALLVLLGNQTADEQASESTKYHNGMGFKGCHAKIGTSFAKFFQRYGYLTPNQLAYARNRMNLAQYHRQLIEAAKAKQAAKA
jgi:hypothetical protein